VENTQAQNRLFSIRAGDAVEKLKARLSLAHPGRLELVIRQDFSVIANIQHFEQCIANLTVNALYYSPENQPVILELEGHSISVFDSGPGLPPQVLERIGEPFNKGDAQSKNHRGTGLGLAMVRSICRLYGWRLEFAGRSPGTRATIHFPEIQQE
jgi:signal transduction histidine kinase